MYTGYANEIIEEDLLYEPSERTSDIQLPPTINTLLLVTWSVIFLFGLAIIYLAKNPVAGALIIAIPTFIGMVIKPTFALCMMMLVLPCVWAKGALATGLDAGLGGLLIAIGALMTWASGRPKLEDHENNAE